MTVNRGTKAVRWVLSGMFCSAQVNLSAVPLGCSAASLYVAVKGNVGPPDHTIQVQGEDGAYLGTLFNEDLTLLPEPLPPCLPPPRSPTRRAVQHRIGSR